MMTPLERLSHDAFFTALTKLLSDATAAQKTSIFLTQKSLTLPTDDGPGTLLIRASDGAGKQQKGTKISTVVRPEELDVFFARYADVCKAGMGALKKRDRKKRKKVKKGDKVEKTAAA